MARERSLRIRPFADVYDAIWNSLEGTTLRTGELTRAPGRHSLSATQLEELASSNPTINVDLDISALREQLAEDALDLDHVRLTVYVSSQFTNLGFIAFSETLDQLKDFPISVGISNVAVPLQDPLRATHSGVSARCVLTLDVHRETNPTALVPTKRHSVLSEAMFRLARSSDESNGIDIHPLDSSIRLSDHVPKNTLIYIKPGEANPLESKVLSEVMTIYFDERVLDKLRVAPNHLESKLMRGLLHDAILNDIAQQSVVELNRIRSEGGQIPSIQDLKGTLLGRLLKVVEKKGQAQTGPQASTEALLDEMMNHPYRFNSRIQSIANLRARAEDAFEGRDE